MREPCIGYYREEGRDRDGLLEEVASDLFFKWTWVTDENYSSILQSDLLSRSLFIGVQLATYEMSYVPFFPRSFPSPPLHLALEIKDFPRAGFQGFMGFFGAETWASLPWALLWGTVDTGPVPRSRGSEDEDQVSLGVSLTIGRTPAQQPNPPAWLQCEFSKSSFLSSRTDRWFTVVLGWDGESSPLADHEFSGFLLLQSVSSPLWPIPMCCFRFADGVPVALYPARGQTTVAAVSPSCSVPASI